MYTSAELQLLRSIDPGVSIPGIDTQTGNPLSSSSLKPLSSITTSSSAPFYYDATNNRVVVNQAGLVLSGYDFGTATVVVNADNVTIQDSSFTGTTGYYAVQVYGTHGTTTVTNNTFNGGGADLKLSAWVTSSGKVAISNNSFIDTPADGLDLFGSGVVSGNYFSGAGYTSGGQHPDAIWVTNTAGPLTITNNFIDWTTNADSNYYTNDGIRITTELGSVSNVTVSGNFLIGGSSSIDAGNTGTQGTFSHISITNNYLGFANYYAFYPGAMSGVTMSGNVVFDYTNAAYSANAWTDYLANGLSTASVLVSTNGSTVSAASASGPTTLYGSPSAHLYGGKYESILVAGYGREYMFGGSGANVFTYLTPTGSSTQASSTTITGFDPAKDVIDLSQIDADLATGGEQTFTFIGTSAFSGSGAQVRYQQNTANDTTTVQATLAGYTSSQLTITINGLVSLSSANFALNSTQSGAAIAAGASLASTYTRSGSAQENVYSNVTGRSYSSYESITSGTNVVADVLNLNNGAGEIDLFQSGSTITRGGSAESIGVGTGSFNLGYHATETINTNSVGSDTFIFKSGFGTETINGFNPSGSSADTLELSTAAFSYLNAGMTQAQQLAAVIANAASTSSGTTIFDSFGDKLTLAGVSEATLTANPSAFKFV